MCRGGNPLRHIREGDFPEGRAFLGLGGFLSLY